MVLVLVLVEASGRRRLGVGVRVGGRGGREGRR